MNLNQLTGKYVDLLPSIPLFAGSFSDSEKDDFTLKASLLASL